MSDKQEIVALLYKMGKELWWSTLNVTPDGERRMKDMDNPMCGDLVIEISTFNLQNASDEDICSAVGYLESESNGTYFIKRLDNGEGAKWGNARFIKLPIKPRHVRTHVIL